MMLTFDIIVEILKHACGDNFVQKYNYIVVILNLQVSKELKCAKMHGLCVGFANSK